MITDYYRPDGIDEHGATVNAGPDYAALANAQHDGILVDHLHNMTMHPAISTATSGFSVVHQGHPKRQRPLLRPTSPPHHRISATLVTKRRTPTFLKNRLLCVVAPHNT